MFSTNRDWKLYAKDILQECKNIKKFTEDEDFEQFCQTVNEIYIN
jgi:uncharacterized protein with HEPN domain